jgi:dipeptidyl aminopeptidase/acylaminoacyl peptidase
VTPTIRRWLAIAALAGCATGAAPSLTDPELRRLTTETSAGRPPIRAFAALPLVDDMAVSPAGTHVAFTQNTDGVTYLVTRGLDDGRARILLATDNQRYRISWFRWVNDERLIVAARYPDRREQARTTETRLLAVNRDGSGLLGELIRIDGGSGRRDHVPQLQDVVLGTVPGDRRRILVSLDLRQPTYPDVYAVDVYSGARRLVQPNVHQVRRWLADRAGVVRAGVALDGTTIRIVVKPPGGEAWTTLQTVDVSREAPVSPLGFDNDPGVLYLQAPHQGRQAVYAVRTSEPGLPRRLVAADPTYDLAGLVYFSWLGRIVGAYYTADEGRAKLWDEDARRLQERLAQALPGRTPGIESSSDDGRRHVVRSDGVTQPPQFHLFDGSTGDVRLLVETYPALKTVPLAASTPITLTARDGLPLRSYLTLPSGRHRQALPLVLFPHGGPAARDDLRFDAWTQFFASRGWAVLQVNFRGSAGYGTAFLEAGFKRWGLDMQDDLEDGVRALIGQGVADPARVCIVGASYGGYAALMGAIKTPDLYRCAVSVAGVSDLRDLIRESSSFLGHEIGVERQLGLWWADRVRLRETSPVHHASRVRAPLLMVHGAEDRTVPVEQSRDMVAALARAGTPNVRYVELPRGDHALSREDDRLRLFLEMERFLSRYLD